MGGRSAGPSRPQSEARSLLQSFFVPNDQPSYQIISSTRLSVPSDPQKFYIEVLAPENENE